MPAQVTIGLAVCAHKLAQRDCLTGRLIDQHVDGTRARLQQVLRQRPAQRVRHELTASCRLRANPKKCLLLLKRVDLLE